MDMPVRLPVPIRRPVRVASGECSVKSADEVEAEFVHLWIVTPLLARLQNRLEIRMATTTSAEQLSAFREAWDMVQELRRESHERIVP